MTSVRPLLACLWVVCIIGLVQLFIINIADIIKLRWPVLNGAQTRSSELRHVQDQGTAAVIKSDIKPTVHLALVCGGGQPSSTRALYTLLKSILYYRNQGGGGDVGALELHLFVDAPVRRTLERLLASWSGPGAPDPFAIHYYDLASYTRLISWIPNEHYSQDFGLLKLVVPSVLAAAGLDQVLMLDTDMLALGDVGRLFELEWREQSCAPRRGTRAGCNSRLLDIAENQSDWYGDGLAGAGAGTGAPNRTASGGRAAAPAAWPAPGPRGFNTGLIRFNLARVRASDWDEIWREVAQRELAVRLKTSLADQDIVNAVLRERPELVNVRLSCRANLQLNDNTDLDAACPGHERRAARGAQPVLVHWNSPRKLDTQNPWAEHYGQFYRAFQNLDATLLGAGPARAPHSARPDEQAEARSTLPQACQGIWHRPLEPLRAFVWFTGEQPAQQTRPGEPLEVTLVTQLSVDRLGALDELAAHWAGPVSAAVHLSEAETSRLAEAVRNSPTLGARKNVALHLAFRDQADAASYPINKLRNLALGQVARGRFVYLTDVDFVPAPRLYEHAKSELSRQLELELERERELGQRLAASSGVISSAGRLALVVPAFETNEYKFEVPQNKSALLSELAAGRVASFRETVWPRGQAATNYARWQRAREPYAVKWELDYEPFVVVARDGPLPAFDERFAGFGWNKVQHNALLAAMGYEFRVLPDAFAVHRAHAASYDIGQYRRSSEYQACVARLKRVFMSELSARYPNFQAAQTQPVTATQSLLTRRHQRRVQQ